MSYKWDPSKKRIPTTKERARKARKRGGFDDSWIDKKALKEMGTIHRCFYCKKHLKPKAYNHRTGEIAMGCDTDDCIGNVDTTERRRIKKLEQLGARRIDSKLVMDLKQLTFGRMPSRMWAIKDRIW